MEDKIGHLYKNILKIIFAPLLFILFVVVVIRVGILGFFIGFGACFGQSECSPLATYSFILLPLAVIGGAIFLYRKWRAYREGHYRQQVKEEVLQELGTSSLAPAEQQRQVILGLLGQYDVLTFADLVAKSQIPNEELLMQLRELMEEKMIVQTIDPEAGARFMLTTKA